MEHLQRLFEKFVPKVLDFRSHHCKELVSTSELNSVVSLCVLFDALATEENGVSEVTIFLFNSRAKRHSLMKRNPERTNFFITKFPG